MKITRVLITTYQSAFLRPGGGETELNNLALILRQLGIYADIYGSTSMNIDAYDVVLHFSVHGESYEFIKSIKVMGKKIILWTNLWWKNDPSEAEKSFVQSFLELADIVVFKSKSEMKNVYKYISSGPLRTEIVPWHIDRKFLDPVPKSSFKQLYDIEDYILWVGVIEKEKNQLTAINALKNLDVPLVFVGSHRDGEYFDSCLKAASNKTLFLPFMDHASKILISAYQDCTVYLELSDEPAGLSALEAALFEKPMVLGRNEWSYEHFGEQIALIDYNSEEEVIRAAKKALQGRFKFAGKRKIVREHLAADSLKKLAVFIDELTQEN